MSDTIEVRRLSAGNYEMITSEGTHTITRLVVTRDMHGFEHRRPGTYWMHTPGGEFSPSGEFPTLRKAVDYVRKHYASPDAVRETGYTAVEDDTHPDVHTVHMDGVRIGIIAPDGRDGEPSGLYAVWTGGDFVGYRHSIGGALRAIRKHRDGKEAAASPEAAEAREREVTPVERTREVRRTLESDGWGALSRGSDILNRGRARWFPTRDGGGRLACADCPTARVDAPAFLSLSEVARRARSFADLHEHA